MKGFFLKNKFTKTLSAIAMSALVTTQAFAAADQIDMTGTINAIVVAGFADVSGDTSNGVFADNAANSIDFGSIAAGDTFTASTNAVYVRTNNAAGASMTITDAVNSGNLAGPGAAIPVAYTFAAAPIVLGTPFDLTVSTDAGSVSVGDFVATPAASAADQAAGVYSTTLAVTIAAK